MPANIFAHILYIIYQKKKTVKRKKNKYLSKIGDFI